ncbi:MAG: 3-deoxy-D-manno-octulosonic acid transferase [Bacteroidales bacterium]|nr:3-deoxy-D-manno-octulosonic acid transferase [Bacteroidales bacterium]MBD5302787.1 3-deoxy-D-manno-octulosonic acid transferase [Bacteroides sp.]
MHTIASDAGRQIFEAPLYSAGIALYRFGVRIAGLHNEKAKKLDEGQRHIKDYLAEHIKPGDRVVWVHAASLGEFEQGRPLIEKIKHEHPEYKILLTFFSPSGYEVRKNYAGADCVCYLPFDTPHRVKRFIDLAHPEIAIFVKYEIWRNYLHELNKRHIPTYLISAAFRPDQFFFRHPGSWYGQWLKWYTHIFVQDEGSRQLLRGLKIEDVDVCGDTRFDRVSDIRAMQKVIPELEAFVNNTAERKNRVMMAGSSWEADEDIYIPWFNEHSDVKLVIAPHEFDSHRLEKLRQRFRNGVVLLSEIKNGKTSTKGVREAQVLIIDCFGLLSSAYAYCDVAYVGGGFGAGLHNINEAAVYDIPVIYGPNNKKFIEAREMAECGGGVPIASASDFETAANLLLGEDDKERRLKGDAAGKYIRSKLGATQKIYDFIFR